MTAREGDGETWMQHSTEIGNDSSGLTPSTLSDGHLPDAGAHQAAPIDGTATASGEAAAGDRPAPEVVLPVDLPTLLRDLENTYIEAALLRTQRNKKEAAKLLGMGRTTLVEKLRRRGRLASGA